MSIPPPEDLAATALFLASDDAAHMFGAFMIADGGYNMLAGWRIAPATDALTIRFGRFRQVT